MEGPTMKHAEGNPAELKQKFWKALAESNYLFLELQGQSDTAVPMSAQLDKDANSAIWLFTHTKSKFAALGPAVATFTAKDHKLYARFDGTLARETSQERFDQFWNNFVAAWYDGGKDDPDILLLRMDLGTAEIWDGDYGLLNTAKMALGINVHDEAEERHVKETAL
jgi:general stress protein 26